MWLFTFFFFTIRVRFRSRQVPSLFLKKFAFPVQIGRQSIPLAKHQADYPVSISLVTETHVSMHILHNLLAVPVVVKCSTECASQHFTHLEHPNILQQTNKHLVQNQPLVIPTHWTSLLLNMEYRTIRYV